jgi:hypothetical protein
MTVRTAGRAGRAALSPSRVAATLGWATVGLAAAVLAAPVLLFAMPTLPALAAAGLTGVTVTVSARRALTRQRGLSGRVPARVDALDTVRADAARLAAGRSSASSPRWGWCTRRSSRPVWCWARHGAAKPPP